MKKNADLLDTEVKGRVMSKSKQLKSVNTAFKSVSYHLEVQKLNITMTDCTVQSIQADSRKLGLISFPIKPLFFTCLQYKSFENTVGKGEIARNEQFLLFPQCFLSFWTTLFHFHQIQNCRLQTLYWKSLKFVVWERFHIR